MRHAVLIAGGGWRNSNLAGTMQQERRLAAGFARAAEKMTLFGDPVPTHRGHCGVRLASD